MKLISKGRRISRTVSIPSPIGGLNARDPYAEMDAKDAVKLENWFPLPMSIQLRHGYSIQSSGLGASVSTVMAYNGGSSQKLFAVANTNFYDCTTTGAVGAAVTTCTVPTWQHVNFATAGGYFLSCVNGVDNPKLYDGTTWTTPAITGVTLTDLITVTVHMNRLWYIQKNTMKVWYLPVSSIAGAAVQIDFSGLFKRGGYLMQMGSWTIDAGSGMDDHAVFISSEGEIAVYKGTDPSSINTWSLVGVYQVGSPVGRRCMSQFASDLLIISQDGLLPMSKALMSSRVNNKISLTDKIQHLMSQDVTDYGTAFGWQTRLFPQANMLLLNVPAGNGANYQYAMNTISGAWCKFTGWNAQCWEMYKDNIYFGDGLGNVCKAWDTFADNGANINSDVIQAFNYFGNQNIKHFKMSKPIFNSNTSSIGVVFGLNIDFNFNVPISTPSFTPSNVGVWGVSKWNQVIWGTVNTLRNNWQSAGGIGYCAGAHLSTSSNIADIQWQSTTLIFEVGSGF
jgi:hypothetical protein